VQKTFSYNYNLLGEALTANFSNFSLTNTYNSAARLTQVQSSLNDATHPPTLFSNPQYNQFGELTSDALGNGVNETFGYDLRGREISVSAVKGMSTVYSLGGPGTGNTMTYTPNSGLSAANDSVNGNWSYGYDALSRIASASKSGGASLSFDIDRNANRWHQNPSGQGAQLSFDSSTNHVASGNGVTYDAAGNVINDGTHSYTYDAEYRITKVDGGTTATYLYDAFGRRAQRVVGPNTYDELYDLGGNVVVELTPSGAAAGYEVFMGGRHLATYSSNLTFFAHTDWLGTERVRTDPSGNVAVSCISNPYGDNQVCTGNDQSRIHYAGMEYDSESSLYHTLFRYYNPRLGLWMTPDPAGLAAADGGDPQSLNRSAYVGNSPINSLDPLGRSYAKVDEPTPQIDPFALLNAYFSWYNSLFVPGSNGLPANTSDYDFNAIDSALASALAASGGGLSLSGGGGGLFEMPAGIVLPSPLQALLADMPWNNPCNPYNNPWGSDICGFGSGLWSPNLGVDPAAAVLLQDVTTNHWLCTPSMIKKQSSNRCFYICVAWWEHSIIGIAWPTKKDIRAACPNSKVDCPYSIEIDTGGKCDNLCFQPKDGSTPIVRNSCIDVKVKN
jgi:RHS repeat-associated protein